MDVSAEHLRHILLFEFRKGSNASEATRNITKVYGHECLSESRSQRWFKKIRKFRKFLNNEEVKIHLQNFFESKPRDFYEFGIKRLLNRWENVANNGGKYIEE